MRRSSWVRDLLLMILAIVVLAIILAVSAIDTVLAENAELVFEDGFEEGPAVSCEPPADGLVERGRWQRANNSTLCQEPGCEFADVFGQWPGDDVVTYILALRSNEYSALEFTIDDASTFSLVWDELPLTISVEVVVSACPGSRVPISAPGLLCARPPTISSALTIGSDPDLALCAPGPGTYYLNIFNSVLDRGRAVFRQISF